MEPLFFKAENDATAPAQRPVSQPASMEPLFFKAENKVSPSSIARPISSFNGAAFFQSGKCEAYRFLRDSHDALQWSRFFSKRKIRSSKNSRKFSIKLQWSRFFSKRKISPGGYEQVVEHCASMEPLFFKAENNDASTTLVVDQALQWSRFFSKRKIDGQKLFHPGAPVASMEPLFFKAENPKRGD